MFSTFIVIYLFFHHFYFKFYGFFLSLIGQPISPERMVMFLANHSPITQLYNTVIINVYGARQCIHKSLKYLFDFACKKYTAKKGERTQTLHKPSLQKTCIHLLYCATFAHSVLFFHFFCFFQSFKHFLSSCCAIILISFNVSSFCSFNCCSRASIFLLKSRLLSCSLAVPCLGS
jgi:hypothetical protein